MFDHQSKLDRGKDGTRLGKDSTWWQKSGTDYTRHLYTLKYHGISDYQCVTSLSVSTYSHDVTG